MARGATTADSGRGLEVAGLARRFGGVTALDEVSFDVRPGRMTGFVGANGAGKTTTMRIVMGVLSPTAGEVRWQGQPVTAADRRSFGYMPEERGLYPKMRVAEQLTWFARLHGGSKADAVARVADLLGRLELAGRADDVLESLSLGNQQRAQIAAALVHSPTALLLDEPFSGLDPLAVDVMAELLREQVDRGVPVLFSSHQLDLVERLCDDVVILSGGRVVAAGAADELRRRGGTAFSLRHPGGLLAVESPLLGPYNVENVAGAAALALALGVEGEAVARAVRGMPQVPGRFERVLSPDTLGFEVVVDYAHTDVGLEAVLKVARAVADAAGGGRVVCVFGAAGERDGAKRPLMGRVAARLAEFGVITTDDAYAEDPAKIAREVAAGAEGGPGKYEVVIDRRAAIRRALEEARPGDVVVVAGKGHERVQHLPEGDVPFHDATVVRELAKELAEKKGG